MEIHTFKNNQRNSTSREGKSALHGKKPVRLFCQYALCFMILGMVSLASPLSAVAQTGTIIGEIRDADTGESLPGATVMIQGTSIGASADADGRYTLRRVSAGEHTLEFRSMGYTTLEIVVTVADGERVEQNAALEGDLIIGDDLIVVARQRGQARALTRQRESVNIRSVVSAEQIEAFGDQTVTDALSRIAGMGHGAGNIRGVGAGASNITMDGQRMGSTGGDRSVDLSTISSDMVQDMEVIKVITPDMDADALSGVINIDTRRPVGGERDINVRIGGGLNPRFSGMTGAGSRASFSYGDSPQDNFSYAINLSYQRDPRSSESVHTSWGIRNFTDIGPSDVISSMSTELQNDLRDRYGSAIQFTFQPSARTTYHVQGMFNYQARDRSSQGMYFNPETNDYISPNETRSPHTANGNFRYPVRQDNYDIYQYTFQFGARHLFDRMDMEYKLGWGHGRLYHDRYDYNFRTDSRYEFYVEFEDRWEPYFDIGRFSQRPAWPGSEQITLSGVENRWTSHTDNEITARIDFEYPYSQGSFKFGTSSILTFKEGDEERRDMDVLQLVAVHDFQPAINRNWSILNRNHHTYDIPYILDMKKALEWYHGTFPNLIMDMETWAANSEADDFYAHEYTFAGYGMGTYNIGRFRFLGGARIEHTEAQYDGKEVTISSGDRFLGATHASNTSSYTHIFPNAQIVFNVSRLTNLRLAYSRSIGRPTFNQLSSSVMWNYSSRTINQGNPHLKPMLSNNMDLLFEHYFLNVGQFTLGFYYKELSDFVYSLSEVISPAGLDGTGEFIGWRRSTFRNGEEATVYGMEVSWQQSLDFLPGFLGNFGTYTNYSYAESIAELDRAGTYRLQDQRPHVVNVGLDYSQGGFTGQLSYHWGAPSISSYASSQRFVPGIQTDRRVYFDAYRDAASDVSLTLRYRLTDSFRLWADASNLLNNQSISYNYHRDYYPSTATLRGRTFNMGIRYTL